MSGGTTSTSIRLLLTLLLAWGASTPAIGGENEYTDAPGKLAQFDQWVTKNYFETNCPKTLKGPTGERPQDSYFSDTRECDEATHAQRMKARDLNSKIPEFAAKMNLTDAEIGEWLWVQEACSIRQPALEKRIREVQSRSLALSRIPDGQAPGPQEPELDQAFRDLKLLQQLHTAEKEMNDLGNSAIIRQNWADDFTQNQLLQACAKNVPNPDKVHPLTHCRDYWKLSPELEKRINWAALDAKTSHSAWMSYGKQAVESMRNAIYARSPALAVAHFDDIIPESKLSEKEFNKIARQKLLGAYGGAAKQGEKFDATCQALRTQPSAELKNAIYNPEFLADLAINAPVNDTQQHLTFLRDASCRIQARITGREGISAFRKEVMISAANVALILGGSIATSGTATIAAGTAEIAGALRLAAVGRGIAAAGVVGDVTTTFNYLEDQLALCNQKNRMAMLGGGNGADAKGCNAEVSGKIIALGLSSLGGIGALKALTTEAEAARLARKSYLEGAIHEKAAIDAAEQPASFASKSVLTTPNPIIVSSKTMQRLDAMLEIDKIKNPQIAKNTQALKDYVLKLSPEQLQQVERTVEEAHNMGKIATDGPYKGRYPPQDIAAKGRKLAELDGLLSREQRRWVVESWWSGDRAGADAVTEAMNAMDAAHAGRGGTQIYGDASRAKPLSEQSTSLYQPKGKTSSASKGNELEKTGALPPRITNPADEELALLEREVESELLRIYGEKTKSRPSFAGNNNQTTPARSSGARNSASTPSSNISDPNETKILTFGTQEVTAGDQEMAKILSQHHNGQSPQGIKVEMLGKGGLNRVYAVKLPEDTREWVARVPQYKGYHQLSDEQLAALERKRTTLEVEAGKRASLGTPEYEAEMSKIERTIREETEALTEEALKQPEALRSAMKQARGMSTRDVELSKVLQERGFPVEKWKFEFPEIKAGDIWAQDRAIVYQPRVKLDYTPAGEVAAIDRELGLKMPAMENFRKTERELIDFKNKKWDEWRQPTLKSFRDSDTWPRGYSIDGKKQPISFMDTTRDNLQIRSLKLKDGQVLTVGQWKKEVFAAKKLNAEKRLQELADVEVDAIWADR